MLKKMGNWFKGHRVSRVLLLGAITSLLVIAMVLPAAFAAAPTYLDVRGTYTVSGIIPAKYLDGSKHPNIPLGTLVITTQTKGVISVATLTMPGGTVSLTGLVGSGNRPCISLVGTTAGTSVSINGSVTKRGAAVTGISGKIDGFITNYGEVDAESDGDAAFSIADANSGDYSALLTAGTGAGSVYVQINNPSTSLKVSNLKRLSAGWSLWYNLADGLGPGPQVELRFTAPNCTNPDAPGEVPGRGHVDVTVMALQAPYTGDDHWHQLILTSDSTRTIYYGNDPVDGHSFSGGLGATVLTLGEIPALINADSIMTGHKASASNWKLTRVRIELWEAGARTCYIDDVKLSNKTYTFEPVRFSGTFKAKK